MTFTPFKDGPPQHGGEQKLYRFDNNFGASVIKSDISYGGSVGLWELAVIVFANKKNTDWALTYDTPITDDVIGSLAWGEVSDLLQKISELPKGGAS